MDDRETIAHKAIYTYESKQGGKGYEYIRVLYCEIGYELKLYAMEQYHRHKTELQSSIPDLHKHIDTALYTIKEYRP